MGIDTVLEKLQLAEKMVTEYLFPEADATEFALRTLTDGEVKPLLLELCDGAVTSEKLISILSLKRLKHLIMSAELWINVEARGQEMVRIITYSGQLTAGEIHARFRALMEALEYYHVVRISSLLDLGRGQYQIELISNPAKPTMPSFP